MASTPPSCPRVSTFPPNPQDNGSRDGLFPLADAETIQKALQPKGSELISLPENLVDLVWTERPPRPANKVFPLDVKYSGTSTIYSPRSSSLHLMHTSPIGQSHADKLRALRTALQKKDNGARATVVNMLDEVAWLLNLRGSDIEYNPVFFAYAYVAIAPVIPVIPVIPVAVDDAGVGVPGWGVSFREGVPVTDAPKPPTPD